MRCVSPWYNHTGWLCVKHHLLTYLPSLCFPLLCMSVCLSVSPPLLSVCLSPFYLFLSLSLSLSLPLSIFPLLSLLSPPLPFSPTSSTHSLSALFPPSPSLCPPPLLPPFSPLGGRMLEREAWSESSSRGQSLIHAFSPRYNSAVEQFGCQTPSSWYDLRAWRGVKIQ